MCHFYLYNWHIFCFCFSVSLPGLAASICLRCTQLSLHPKNTKAERTRGEFMRMMMCTPCWVKLSSVYTLTFINFNSLPCPFRPSLVSSWTFWTKLQSSGNCRDRKFDSLMWKGKFWTSIDSVRYLELLSFYFSHSGLQQHWNQRHEVSKHDQFATVCFAVQSCFKHLWRTLYTFLADWCIMYRRVCLHVEKKCT